MSDDPMMPIDVFSTASLVFVKALRRYHEDGLLVPAAIDTSTGYRSYRVSQLVDAQVIKRLRDLDVPLRAVAEIVRARDPEVTGSVIAGHEQVMRERLVDLARLVDELQAALTRPAERLDDVDDDRFRDLLDLHLLADLVDDLDVR